MLKRRKRLTSGFYCSKQKSTSYFSKETIAALQEAERLSKAQSVKESTDIDESIADLKK